MLGLATDIGIDLGTASSLVYVKGKGVVLNEPSVVALEQDTSRVVAIGEEARRMLGRTPGNIVAVKPLRDGVIASFELTERMLRHFISKVCGRRMLFHPRVAVCVPSGITSVERRAVIDACLQAGARRCFLIEEPLAAAIGAGIDFSQPSGAMVVDIGGGTTDVAVLSMGQVVVSRSVRVAGNECDEAITRYVRTQFGVVIGERTAEEIKIEAGTAWPRSVRRSVEVRGRDLATGLPKTVTITSGQVHAAIKETLETIVHAVRAVLEQTPPELAADIIDKGIVLTGGGALLHGLERYLSQETGVAVHLVDDPVTCVVRGTGLALEGLGSPQTRVSPFWPAGSTLGGSSP
ncbi:MAG TPA: rod shape-determining protein [Clostridiales bacterium]|nr:rod shape-determining protein [Clostridiales bacterium]